MDNKLTVLYGSTSAEFTTMDDFVCVGTLKAWIVNNNPGAPLDVYNLNLNLLKEAAEGNTDDTATKEAADGNTYDTATSNSSPIQVASYTSVMPASVTSTTLPQPLPPGSKVISIILNAHNNSRVELIYVSASTTRGELKTAIRQKFGLASETELELISGNSLFRNKQDTEVLGDRFLQQINQNPEAHLTVRIPEPHHAPSDHTPTYVPGLFSYLIVGGTFGLIAGTVAGTAIAGSLGYLAQGASQESLAIVFGTTIPGSFLLGLLVGGIAFAKASADSKSPA